MKYKDDKPAPLKRAMLNAATALKLQWKCDTTTGTQPRQEQPKDHHRSLREEKGGLAAAIAGAGPAEWLDEAEWLMNRRVGLHLKGHTWEGRGVDF